MAESGGDTTVCKTTDWLKGKQRRVIFVTWISGKLLRSELQVIDEKLKVKNRKKDVLIEDPEISQIA